MSSAVEICNNALIQLGAEDTLLSLDDDTTPGRMCKAMYDVTRREVLTNFAWNSALKQAQLAALVETPTFEFTYAFQLPADCFRVLKIGTSDDAVNTYLGSDPYAYHRWQPVQWKRFGRKIYSNTSPLYITYIYDLEDVQEMDPALRDAIAARLAAKIAYKITGSRAKEETMKAWYREVIDEAMATNSLEGSTDAISAVQTIVVR